MDYNEQRLYHLVYQRGVLVKKIVESNNDILERVWSYNLKDIIDKHHETTFKFNFKNKSEIKVMRKGGKIVIGYCNEHSSLDGICFKLNVD